MLIIASSRQLWEQESSTALLLASLHSNFKQPLGAHPVFSPAEVNTLASADVQSIAAYKIPAPKPSMEQMLIVPENMSTT